MMKYDKTSKAKWKNVSLVGDRTEEAALKPLFRGTWHTRKQLLKECLRLLSGK